jgi:amidase
MPEFTGLLERQDAARSRLLSWVKDYDVVLCPAAGEPAQPIDLGPSTPPVKPGADYMRIHNSTGWPAAVVRAGTSPEGLPIGDSGGRPTVAR